MDIPLELRTLDYIKTYLFRKGIKGPFLEIGCGDGINLARFSCWGMQGQGVEISQAGVAGATKRRLPGIEIVHGDFSAVEVGTYPLVFLLNCLEHVEDDAAFLRKAARATQEGGTLVLALPAKPEAYGYADVRAGHYRRYSRASVEALLRSAELEIDEIRTLGFPVCNFYTWFYNLFNGLFAKKPVFDPRSSGESGIHDHFANFPPLFRWIAKFAFPVLTILIRLDFAFSQTDLGNSYLVFARRRQSKAELSRRAS